MMDNNGKKQRTSFKYLWGYVITLFAISLGLIFLSYGSQQKLKNELINTSKNLDTEIKNADSMENLIKLQQKTIEQMRKNAAEISTQIQTLNGLVDQLEQIDDGGNQDTAEDENQNASAGSQQSGVNNDDVTDDEKMSNIISQMREVTDNLSRQTESFLSVKNNK